MNMMIEYRAWHKQEKVMCSINIINLERVAFLVGVKKGMDTVSSDSRWIVYAADDGRFCPFEDIVLMPYTGVNDINGNKVYENDIVKVPYGVGKVVFHSGCYWIEWIDDKESYMELLGLDKTFRQARTDIELLGNIYQHKHLIQQYI